MLTLRRTGQLRIKNINILHFILQVLLVCYRAHGPCEWRQMVPSQMVSTNT